MGSCLSKKSTNASPPNEISNTPLENTKVSTQVVKAKAQEETVKKEIFVIKHRKSHEVERRSDDEKGDAKKGEESGECRKNGVGAPVRTSSCTKEEVDAILIQCGRLSRSSSTGKAGLSGSGGDNNVSSQKGGGGGKRYCGSKRSFDFDNEKGDVGSEEIVVDGDVDEEGGVGDRVHRHRQRHRQSRTPTSSSQGRRRTPSREREQNQQARSGSKERGSGNGRRVSRSPGRRSESPITSSNGANGNTSTNAKPQKMVSVPAMAMDKGSNNNGVGGETIKRIQVKRNVGSGEGARTAASPRARSPARTNGQNQPGTLSRSNSRKAEQSPYRRNPLSEIDNNVVVDHRPISGTKAANNVSSQASALKVNVVVNAAGPESLKPHGVARTRSSRLSRDLDINPEALTDPTPSTYTALLLEDIHNFHQKTTTAPPAGFSLPACVTKANSILEAVADLNSSTGCNVSSAFSENRKRLEIKEPFVESEVVGTDDLMEPSFHKYVTVRRGTTREGEMDEEESSGSNSFVGSQQHWVSSSSWEPNSADSTDRWTSSRSNKDDDFNPLGLQRNAIEVDETRRTTVTKRRDSEQNGIGRGRIGSRGIHGMATTATAGSS